MDLYIRTPGYDYTEEALTDFEVARRDSANGDKQLTVTILKTERNEHAYGMVANEHIFHYGNEPYVIKSRRERIVGNTVRLECQAIHQMFDDLKNNYIYEQVSGTYRIRDLISFATSGTGYYFSVNDADLPISILVENFGDDNSLSLFKTILDRFGAEFDVMGTYVMISKEVGTVTGGQIRYKFNVNDPQTEIDTKSFATYIRGYGKQNEDGSYVAYQTYTSPLASVYGLKHAKPVRDERFTDDASLLDRIKRELHDSMDISLTLTYADLHNLGLSNYQSIGKGDYIWCILEPFDIDVRIRVMDIEDYSDSSKPPQLTIGTISRKASDVMARFNATQSTVNKVIDSETNTVRQRALSIETNYVVDAIERTFAQVDYTDDISVTDPSNFMRKVGLRKGGIYRTNDGHNRIFVITPDGIDLEQSFGKLKESQVQIGPGSTFAEGYDPTQIEIPEVDEATETSAGLMSAPDKVKLNQIVISENGQVIDLSLLVGKIEDLETEIENVKQRLTDLEGAEE